MLQPSTIAKNKNKFKKKKKKKKKNIKLSSACQVSGLKNGLCTRNTSKMFFNLLPPSWLAHARFSGRNSGQARPLPKWSQDPSRSTVVCEWRKLQKIVEMYKNTTHLVEIKRNQWSHSICLQKPINASGFSGLRCFRRANSEGHPSSRQKAAPGVGRRNTVTFWFLEFLLQSWALQGDWDTRFTHIHNCNTLSGKCSQGGLHSWSAEHE